MHELSVCQSILSQAGRIARENGAERIERVVVQIGPLSGVEPSLLERAFEIARADAGQETAVLDIETPPVTIRCTACGAECEVTPNELACRQCGEWRVQLLTGSEMILKSVELAMPDEAAPAGALLN